MLHRRYENANKKGDYDEEQQKRENAKHALERYMHYYQRWAENDKARLQVSPHSVSCQGKKKRKVSSNHNESPQIESEAAQCHAYP